MAKADEAQTKAEQEKGKLFRDFLDEFKDESDRAAVIIGAAKLDYLLYQVLIKYLLPNIGSRDELLDGDSPLSTFSAKINICYRLGIIDAGFARAIHMVRRIRNAFAHEVSGCKLDSGPHADRIRELVSPYVNTKFFKASKDLLFNENHKEIFFGDKPHHSTNFFTMLSILVMRLEWLLDEIVPISTSGASVDPFAKRNVTNQGNDAKQQGSIDNSNRKDKQEPTTEV